MSTELGRVGFNPSTSAYVSEVATYGNFNQDDLSRMDVTMTFKERRTSQESHLLEAEALPQSLAYLLAAATAVPIEVGVPHAHLNWYVDMIAFDLDYRWGAQVEMKFTSAVLLDGQPTRLLWPHSDYTAPRWFVSAVRRFVGPLFSVDRSVSP